MANNENLKPFTKGKDPRRNVTGANRRSITEHLKEFGEKKTISYSIVLTDTKGDKKVLKGKITGRGSNGTINQLIATQLLSKAVKGDLRAIQELLDRTEGKPKQSIDIENLKDGFKVGYTPDNDD